MPTLHQLTGTRAGADWPIVGDRYAIGRSDRCDLMVEQTPPTDSKRKENIVSRWHALISFVDGQWYIEDGDGKGKPSHNHTHVNDERLPHPGRRPLWDGDRIRICHLEYVFRGDDASTFAVEEFFRSENSGRALEGQPADRLLILLEISAALRAALDVDLVLEKTLEHLFRMFPQAERGLVFFRENPAKPLTIRASGTRGGQPADRRFSASVVRRCLEESEAILGNDLTAQFPHIDSINDLPSRSLMCAPLWATDGKSLGVLQLDRWADGSRFTAGDLRLLLGVASQVSIAIGNARLHRRSLEDRERARDVKLTQDVHRALLPARMPAVAGYEFAAHYQSALEVGGDYYDFVPMADGRLAVLLGDVEGKGVPAALFMAKFGVEAGVCFESETDPPVAVGRLNARVWRTGPPVKHVTLAAAVLDPVGHTVSVVTAGHPSPFLIDAAGRVTEVLPGRSSGFMIGMVPDATYESVTVPLRPGDRLLLYSDGASDARDSVDVSFDVDGIRAALSAPGSAAAAVDRLVAAIRGHVREHDPFDDITLVCVGRAAG